MVLRSVTEEVKFYEQNGHFKTAPQNYMGAVEGSAKAIKSDHIPLKNIMAASLQM